MNYTPLKKQGFTLIELIIVIIILGILAVIAAPKFIDISNDAKITTLKAIGGSVRSGLVLVGAKANIADQAKGSGSIEVNGISIPLYNGQPAVDGNDSFAQINAQVKAWLDIDAVDRNTARNDRNAARFFTDKASSANQIYIFFTEDYDKKSVNFNCHILYENPISSTPKPPVVLVKTSEC